MLSVVMLIVIMLSVMAPPHLPQRAKHTYESAEAKGSHFEEDKVDNLKSSFQSKTSRITRGASVFVSLSVSSKLA